MRDWRGNLRGGEKFSIMRIMDDAELTSILHAKMSSARGGKRPSTPFTIGEPRILDESDLGELVSPSTLNSAPAPLQRLRSTHHRLAQLVAEGMKAAEISLITGYSQSRISILKSDPAFQELVSHYENQKDAVFLDVQERLADLGLTATEELRERLEESPESFTVKELLEVQASALDRSVAPKKSSMKTETNVTLSWAQLVEETWKKDKTIDVTPSEVK